MAARDDKPIKLLVAAGLYPPDIGGPATYAKMLEEELPKHGIELVVFPFGEVRRYPKVIRHVVYAWRLWRHAQQCDLIYALDPVSVGVPVRLVSILMGKKYLVRLGGDYAWEQGQQRFGLTVSLDEYTANHRGAPLIVRILAKLQTWVVRGATKVILPSDYLKNIVKSWGVNEAKLVRIYSVLHPLKVTASRSDLRDQLQYTNPTIVTAGRLVPWKGVSTLLQVTAELRKDNSELSLVVVGDGPERKKLEAEADKLGIGKAVRFTGSLSKDALAGVIKAADVFVLNTAYEGLSHQLLEVMDLEVPVVTTKVGGNLELIKDGYSGLLVDYDDVSALQASIIKLATDQNLAKTLTLQAKIKTKDFDRSFVTEQLVELIKTETSHHLS